MSGKVATGAALQFCIDAFGGPVVENDSAPTVQANATVIVDGNGDRVALIILNQSATDVYIHFDPAVSTTNGILLSAKGGSVSMDVTRDFTFPSRRWYGIGNGGAAQLTVLELERYALTNVPGAAQ